MTQGSILITEQNPFSSKEMAKVINDIRNCFIIFGDIFSKYSFSKKQYHNIQMRTTT